MALVASGTSTSIFPSMVLNTICTTYSFSRGGLISREDRNPAQVLIKALNGLSLRLRTAIGSESWATTAPANLPCSRS
jgi:hypothetical protein